VSKGDAANLVDDASGVSLELAQLLGEPARPNAFVLSLDNERYTHFIPISPDFSRLSADVKWLVQAKSTHADPVGSGC
jgi:hypothetical protein